MESENEEDKQKAYLRDEKKLILDDIIYSSDVLKVRSTPEYLGYISNILIPFMFKWFEKPFLQLTTKEFWMIQWQSQNWSPGVLMSTLISIALPSKVWLVAFCFYYDKNLWVYTSLYLIRFKDTNFIIKVVFSSKIPLNIVKNNIL